MPLSAKAKQCLATMTPARAEALVRAYAVAGREGPDVEAAFEFLFAGQSDAECNAIMARIDRETPDQLAGGDVTGADAGAAATDILSPFDAVRGTDAAPGAEIGAVTEPEPGEADADGEAVSPIEWLLEQEPYRRRYVRVPLAVLHGEVGALLERACPGLAWLFVVLLHHADQRDRVVSATKATLCREAGLVEDRTLDKRLRLLCQGCTPLGLPPLLRVLPGARARFAFRREGLVALAELARRRVTEREQRFAALRRAQSSGGRAGMASRWGPPPRRGR